MEQDTIDELLKERLQTAMDMLRSDKYDEALLELRELQKKARFPEHSFPIAQSLNLRGIIAKKRGQYAESLDYYQNALRIFERINNMHHCALVLGNIGVVYKNLSDYQQSLQYYQKALEIYEQINIPLSEAIVLGNIGILYRHLEKYDTALAYLFRALAINEEHNNIHGIETELGNIGNVYKDMGEYDAARSYQLRALSLVEQINSPTAVMTLHANLGSIDIELGYYDNALDLFEKALTLCRELQIIREEGIMLEKIGFILSRSECKRHSYAEAIAILKKAIAISTSLSDKVTEYKCHHTLADIYKHQEEWRLSAYHFEQFYHVQKEVQSKEAKELAERMAFRNELGKKKIESELLKKKNAELHELNEFKTQLLGIAAHDLKNPLSSIIGASRVVRSELSENDSNHEWVDIIIDSATRMQHLIGSLLESTSASLGKMELQLAEVNVVELIQNSIEMNKQSLESKSQYIMFHTPAQCVIHADERKLYQVTDNIISNAIKYSYPNTLIEITLRNNNDDTITLMVKDEGQGLDEQDLSKVFGQFQRLSSQPTAGESSTGLGLHIVKHIVELHGGTIVVESEGKNKGCVFTVILPVRAQ